MTLFKQGSGVRFLNSQDQKKHGKSFDLIVAVSEAIEANDIDRMRELLEVCEKMKKPLAAKRLRAALNGV